MNTDVWNAYPFAERLAAAVLEWLDAAGWLRPEVDLCLIEAVPGVGDLQENHVTISGGRRWALAHVDGDLALRLALAKAEGMPLIALCDRGEDAFQADLRERAVLRRVIRPLARHLLAAVADRETSAIDDDRFRNAIIDMLARDPTRLREAVLRRTWGTGIRDQDAAAILCDAAFGFDDRQSSTTAPELWTKWVLEPPSYSEFLRDLAYDVLQRRYPAHAAILQRVLDDGPREALTRAASVDNRDGVAFEHLAFDTARMLRAKAPNVLANVLETAEASYVRSNPSDSFPVLLEQAFLNKFRQLAIQCSSAIPPNDEEIEHLSEFVYAGDREVDALRVMARVARGLRNIEARPCPSSLTAYAEVWLQSVAWLDRAVRRLRTTHVIDAEFTRISDDLVAQWYEVRDRWNVEFAELLTVGFPKLFSSPGENGPLVVSHLLKYVVRPSIDKQKTFLVVLDGCDIPTFLELLDAFSNVGVGPTEPVNVALSAIPTMTSHARRAIFGGDIPGDGLPYEDDRSADAARDIKAFESHTNVLGALPRKLFLKGDFNDGGAKLIEILEKDQHLKLVAAVFNDIDDALSSKQRLTLPEQTLNNVSRAFRDAVFRAAEAGWRIIVTADHGNTPYREPDIVVSGFGGGRYVELVPGATTPANAVVFEKGVGLPYRIAALYQLGAHGGPQHVGYHGGVGIEEMFVPLAVLGNVAPGSQALEPPTWWSGAMPSATTGPASTSLPKRMQAVKENGHAKYVAQCRAVLERVNSDPKNIAMLEAIAEAGVLAPPQLASKLSLPQGRVRLRVTGLIAKLRDAGIDPPIVIEDEPEAFRWVGPQ